MPSRKRLAIALATVALMGYGANWRVTSTAASRDADAALPTMPAPVLSRFDVPLAYDFTDILQTVERAIPQTLGSMTDLHQIGDNDRKHYAFVATRSPFTAYARGSLVYLSATIAYSARAYYKTPLGPTINAGCGREGAYPQIIIELVSPLTLTPEWGLKSDVRMLRLTAGTDSTRDRCRVSFLGLDMTDRVIDAAKSALSANLREIDRRVARITLAPKATGWWRQMNRPIRLADGAWLLLQPQRLRLKGISGEGHTLVVQAGLDAFPVVVTGRAPHRVVPPLPQLGSDTGTAGFRVLVDGVLDYATASGALNDGLRGKSVSYGGRSLVVQSALTNVESGGRIAVVVTFTGDATGALRFIGTPTYDVAAGKIAVADLAFDLRTDNDLLNAFAWLKSDELLTFFRHHILVPIGPVAERAKGLITHGLNRTIDGVLTLSTVIDSLAVVSVVATRRGLAVRAMVAGSTRASVQAKQ